MRKSVPFLVALVFSGFINAQTITSFDFKFNHLAVSVKDVDRSANFYKEVLNLPEITNRSKLEGVRWFSLGGEMELHLISFVTEKVTVNKAVHLAVTTPEIDAFVKRLDSFKITYSDWPGTVNKVHIRADGIKQVFFQDPDGYWIEVNSDLKRSK